MSDEAIRTAIASKLSWLQQHREKFTNQKYDTRKEFVTGESHYYRGTRYLLTVIEHSGRSKLLIRDESHIDLYVKPGASRPKREKVFAEWYRKELKADILPLICKWEKIIGVTIDEWGVKRMRTRWGTCNRRAKRIWLNLELAKKPVECLEFIIVHEMVHLLEKGHNARFKAFMDEFLPEWRTLRKELNRQPLTESKCE
jgi:hypothetical protein